MIDISDYEIDKDWEHFELYNKIKDAINALPLYFKSGTNLFDIMPEDIPTLNSMLGRMVEHQVVEVLNKLRSEWDDGSYSYCYIKRQPETFPDCLFVNKDKKPIFGIELKGWYLLSKEGEPSYRYTVSEQVCNNYDLLVIVPWALSGAVCGTPLVYNPFMISAKYAAAFRNYHWQNIRKTKSDSTIISPENSSPYPKRGDHINDMPVEDNGNNFGRLARTGMMDSFITMMYDQDLCGIRMDNWLKFMKSAGE